MKHGSYKTIKKPAESLFKDRGSKFIGFACPVKNETEVKDLLDKLRMKYHDASHHCYAWRLGPEKEHFRSNDDGEPSNTAGKPIMGQIQKHDLTNIIIVVIRYFGGTLLGTGGLINAYRKAAADALEQSAIITETVDEVYDIEFPYSAMNMVMKVLKEEQAEQVMQDFSMKCAIRVRIPLNKSEKLTKRLERIDSVNYKKVPGSY